MPTFHIPGPYQNPFTSEGRARTIAAFYIAQGNLSNLTNAEMRCDILNALTSPKAVGYWLNEKRWLEFVRKIGRVRILRLTPSGLITCANSVAGGSAFPTTPELVAEKRRLMLEGGHGHTPKTFPDLAE